MPKFLILTDTHMGFSAEGDRANIDLLHEAKLESPDAILISGDIGNTAPDTEVYLRLLRRFFPEIPVVGVLGNHDLWFMGESLEEVFASQRRAFERHNCVLLEGGVTEVLGVEIFGFTGWYYCDHASRDSEFIRDYAVKVFRDLQNRSDREFLGILSWIDGHPKSEKPRVLLTHFHWPRIGNPELTDLQRLSYYGANPRYAEYAGLWDVVVMGHSHEEVMAQTQSTVMINAGSNYEEPRFTTIEF